MHRNLLGEETSPYLLQHKDNPVHWQPWGQAALDEAGRRDKPILLSIGYAACHWCHVMAHESFEDQATAALMNDLFVNIKVDREERPDLDMIFQSAIAILGENGGWPLTLFLTPSGEPFWGGTYFPPTPRYGRPGFKDVLERVADAYHGKRDAVHQSVKALRGAMRGLAELPKGGALPRGIADRMAERLVQDVDFEFGGFGAAPKFPQPNIFELLWRAHRRSGDPRYRDAVTITLDRMCQGGLYDHLGGGFARYSVDAEWLVPHFEKMLYDNAQLIELLTLVWQETKSPLYRLRITETAEWLLREMRHADGAFFSSLDADSDGEEGRFYVWTAAEIDALLGEDAPAFKSTYDVQPSGNWEGRTILNRRRARELADFHLEARLARSRTILLKARGTRVRPGLDDKILADWNGLTIAALANAGVVFEQPAWIEAAARSYRFVRQHMMDKGRLCHTWRNGRSRHPAIIDDYANLARGGLALLEATADSNYLADVEGLVSVAHRYYWDTEASAYYLSADDTRDVLFRIKSAHDQAVPAGNSTMVSVLARLFYLTGKSEYRQRAEAILGAFSGEIARNILPFATLINAHSFLNNAVQIVLIGKTDDPVICAMCKVVQDASLPDRIIQVVDATDNFPIGHPAFGKSAVNGRSTAYVCRGPVCSLPIMTPDILQEALAQT